MSRRTRDSQGPVGSPFTIPALSPQPTMESRRTIEKAPTTTHRLSMASNSSAGRRSSTSLDGVAGASRPSGIPRPTRSGSSVRPSVPPTSKPHTVHLARPNTSTAFIGVGTRSAPSGRPVQQAASFNNSPRIVTDEDLLSLEPPLLAFERDQDTVLGMAVPYKQPTSATLPPRLIPELQALAAASQRRHTPAISTISTISSPSTQFSASPSPWSASTANSTPISWPSASPSLVQPTRLLSSTKRSQTVPMPSAVRTVVPNFSVPQKGVMMTSSPLTGRKYNEDATVSTPVKAKKKKTPRNSPAPTPPPRLSSIKRTLSGSSTRKSVDDTRAAVSDVPPLPREQGENSEVRDNIENSPAMRHAMHQRDIDSSHKKLQQAIVVKPPRPSRDGIEELDVRKPQRINHHRLPSNEQIGDRLEAGPIEALPQGSLARKAPATAMPGPDASGPSQSSRSRLGKFSKLVLFGKSSKKTAENTDVATQDKKLQRRGPTAGTGHEGYTKFGRRERKTSSDVSNVGTDSESSVVSTQRKPVRTTPTPTGHGASNGRRNRTSQSDLDDFAATRLKPVVMLGGSQKAKESPKLDMGLNNIADDAGRGATASAIGQTEERHASIASTGPLMRDSRLIFHLGSLDRHDQPKPSLAVRRSQKFDNVGSFRLPQPIDIRPALDQPYPSNHNVSQSSIAPTSAALSDVSIDSHTVDNRLQKQRKKSRKLNWRFFRKKESAPERVQPNSTGHHMTPAMAVRVSPVPQARSVPYYAMLESENESNNAEEIEHFLAEAARNIAASDAEGPASMIEDSESEVPERVQSILLPATPQFLRDNQSEQRLDSSQESLLTQVNLKSASQPTTRLRQPRLAQVGRIPKVVSTTQGSLPSQSLALQSPQLDIDTDRQKASENFKKPTGSHSLPNRARNECGAHSAFDRTNDKAASIPIQMGLEHLTSSTYKSNWAPSNILDRYSTTSSSSDGAISVMGPALLPAPEFSIRHVLRNSAEEDVWKEYDDFIDRVVVPTQEKTHKDSATSGEAPPVLSLHRDGKPTGKTISSKKLFENLAINTSLAPPSLRFPSHPSPKTRGAEVDLRLRRSRIISALHSSLDPSSPFSIGDYLAELGEADRHSGQLSDHSNDPNVGGNGLAHSPEQILAAFPEPPVTKIEHLDHHNAGDRGLPASSKDQVRSSETAYASLMVSRWLSFGRVLFSPAHVEIEKQPGRHVLVIDGLGSEDWSLYCATTYQAEEAYIYDLKETATRRGMNSPITTTQGPQNFRRRNLTDFTEAFQFPDNFFSVIVLRFLPIMADSKLQKIVSECRRVLAPGGYIELVLLDLDIVNMGVLTRKAMRNLKTRIAMRHSEVSLKPVIDHVQSVLHEQGFAKLSRCIVGVPVVGKPPTADSPTSSHSSEISDMVTRSPSAGPRPLEGLNARQHHNFSLNDLVADYSDKADAKIGRAVSRTARRWWQQCFESAAISDGNLAKSIFADKHVLSECKSRASSFKLLIAYTQKPATTSVTAKRRTMSEPTVATLAMVENL